MREQGSIGEWLEERCKSERLPLREAGAKTGLSHSTIRDIINGTRPLPGTISKLARAFGGNGTNQQMALEDHLLLLAGYIRERPGEELNEVQAQLMDKVKKFNERQLKMMVHFADFLAEIDGKEGANP